MRDRFSVDGWMALTDLDKTARALAQRVQVGDDVIDGTIASRLADLKLQLAG